MSGRKDILSWENMGTPQVGDVVQVIATSGVLARVFKLPDYSFQCGIVKEIETNPDHLSSYEPMWHDGMIRVLFDNGRLWWFPIQDWQRYLKNKTWGVQWEAFNKPRLYSIVRIVGSSDDLANANVPRQLRGKQGYIAIVDGTSWEKEKGPLWSDGGFYVQMEDSEGTHWWFPIRDWQKYLEVIGGDSPTWENMGQDFKVGDKVIIRSKSFGYPIDSGRVDGRSFYNPDILGKMGIITGVALKGRVISEEWGIAKEDVYDVSFRRGSTNGSGYFLAKDLELVGSGDLAWEEIVRGPKPFEAGDKVKVLSKSLGNPEHMVEAGREMSVKEVRQPNTPGWQRIMNTCIHYGWPAPQDDDVIVIVHGPFWFVARDLEQLTPWPDAELTWE